MRLVVLAVLALASPAAADGFYFTESFGGSDVKNDLGEHMSSAVHFRIGLGVRRDAWALEGHIGAHIGLTGNLHGTSDGNYHQRQDLNALTTFGLDVKYIQPITSKHFEAYLRGGLRYGMLDDGTALHDYGGRGLGGGAGIQLKGKVRALGFLAWPFFFLKIGPKVTAALWLDADYSFYRLHRDGRIEVRDAVDATITTISGGFAVGSDF